MSYKRAVDLLPKEILEIIQEYVEGEYVYIPKIEDNKKQWGENTMSKEKTLARNKTIYQKHLQGISTRELSKEYFLSQKTIQKIICKLRKCHL